MNQRTLNRFKKIFEEQRRQILFNDRILRDDFSVNEDDRFDEVDQATTDIEQSMRMRLRNREVLYLKKVEQALERIQSGEFGKCDTCEEPIELKRLEARPTASLCVSCKEDEERKEILTSHGRKSKSIGEAFSRSYQ